MNNESSDSETKQERREKKLQKKRERIPKHGRGLARIYQESILKRLRREK